MALETLKNIKKIGGFDLLDINKHCKSMSALSNFAKLEQSRNKEEFFIHVNHDRNSITFRIQNGPIKENGVNGVNGCQVDTIVETAKTIIEGLNKKFPCNENDMAIQKLTEALTWMEERKKDRIKRGVEGFDKA